MVNKDVYITFLLSVSVCTKTEKKSSEIEAELDVT